MPVDIRHAALHAGVVEHVLVLRHLGHVRERRGADDCPLPPYMQLMEPAPGPGQTRRKARIGSWLKSE